MFNILGRAVEGAQVLELFAGAGTLGLEALSRGASHATFVEVSSKHASLIEDNAARMGFARKSAVINADAYRCRDLLESAARAADIVFLDPPYDDTRSLAPDTPIVALIEDLALGRCVAQDAVLVIQHPRAAAFDEAPRGWDVTDVRTYGSTAFTFMERS